MELFVGAPLPLSLAVLALVDSLSVGTLLIPLFLLLSPGRVRVGRVVLYLATIAGFYLAVGLLFLWGLVNLVDVAAEFFASPAGVVLRLAVGAALVLTALLIRSPSASPGPSTAPAEVAARSSLEAAADPARPHRSLDAATPPARAEASSGRLVRWRERLLAPDTTRLALMTVAVAAGLVEVATMLPYIMAMTMLADSGVDTPMLVVTLSGYCLVMIVPAALLLMLRVLAADLVRGPLQRLADWMQRTGRENTAWIVGGLGFLIARAAATELGLLDGFGSLFGGVGEVLDRL